MKTIKLLLFAAFLGSTVMTVSSCSKYEEGPKFTVLTKKMRLTGDWDLKEVVSPNGNTSANNDDDYSTFEKDGTAKYVSGNIINTGTWEFSSNKEKLRVTYPYFGVDVVTERTIIRLTNKELWLKDEDGYIYKAEAK